jgi:hypothetical protein
MRFTVNQLVEAAGLETEGFPASWFTGTVVQVDAARNGVIMEYHHVRVLSVLRAARSQLAAALRLMPVAACLLALCQPHLVCSS